MNASLVRIWQVDAFAEKPFTGNPAGVCILDAFPSDDWMQQVAMEMNLAETAFVVPAEGDRPFQLRWFTPLVEVDLCGHATLAAAHTLIEQKIADPDQPIRFHTRSGELQCTSDADRLTLNFPATPPGDTDEIDPATQYELRVSLGLQTAEVLRSKFDHLVVVDRPEIVLKTQPDWNALSNIETRGVILTAPSDQDGIDFVSRFFAPRCGINEDPVTGSAHCCLAPYWAAKLGRSELTGYQASRRGGRVGCRIKGDRVELTGMAVTVLEGHFRVPVE